MEDFGPPFLSPWASNVFFSALCRAQGPGKRPIVSLRVTEGVLLTDREFFDLFFNSLKKDILFRTAPERDYQHYPLNDLTNG